MRAVHLIRVGVHGLGNYRSLSFRPDGYREKRGISYDALFLLRYESPCTYPVF